MYIKINDQDYDYYENTGKFTLYDKEAHFSFHAGRIEANLKDKETIKTKILHEMNTKGNASGPRNGMKK